MQTGISIQHRGSFVYLDYNYTCTNTYQKIKGCGGNFRFILSSFNKIFSINFENLCINYISTEENFMNMYHIKEHMSSNSN